MRKKYKNGMETVARGSRRCGFGQRNWLDLSLLSGSPDDAQRLRMRPHTRHKPVLFFLCESVVIQKKSLVHFFSTSRLVRRRHWLVVPALFVGTNEKKRDPTAAAALNTHTHKAFLFFRHGLGPVCPLQPMGQTGAAAWASVSARAHKATRSF